MRWSRACLIVPSFAVLSLVLVLAPGRVLHAQAPARAGLITAVDLDANMLVLETRGGPQRIRVAATAIIREDHGALLSIHDLRPGDAVAYHMESDTATSLRVARQFWAIPPEW